LSELLSLSGALILTRISLNGKLGYLPCLYLFLKTYRAYCVWNLVVLSPNSCFPLNYANLSFSDI
jgi:hypothetical protein